MSKKPSLIIACMMVALVLCVWLLFGGNSANSENTRELEVLCAAGLRKPVEEVAGHYEAEYGVKIHLNYGGSGQLYGTMRLRGGDLYIPADASYIRDAKNAGLVVESLPLSHLTAGIIVAKENPKNIKNLADLERENIRVALASESSAVGKFTHKVLREEKMLDNISNGELNTYPTVNEVALQVKLRTTDAGIVWDALMSQYENCEFIHVPEFTTKPKSASVGIVTTSKNPTRALQFAQYLAAQKSAEIFKKHGFHVLSELDEK